MISIVFSTKTPKPNFIKHVKYTIGLKKWEYEIIEVINNSDKESKWFNGGKSLTEAYIEGLNKSKYEIVVFCHDDIIFETKKWGKKLFNNFDKTDYGIIGMAGALSLTESGFWGSNPRTTLGIVNHLTNGRKFKSTFSVDLGDNIAQVVALDGLFFAVRKDRLKYQFDSGVKGFHFYDIDFTFGNHVNGCKVGVMFNIRLTHKSEGDFNDKWKDARVYFLEKWGELLPLEIKGEIFFNKEEVKLKVEPKVSVIITTKGNLTPLFKCITSICDKSRYDNIEIIVADTGSTEDEIKKIEEFKENFLQEIYIKLIKYDIQNINKVHNDVVNNHLSNDCELLLFCDSNIKLINDAITNMVKVYNKNKNNVGTIGGRIYYPNNKLYHCGVVSYLNKDKKLMFTHLGISTNYRYQNEPEVISNTDKFILISKSLFLDIGGFNEYYEECFGDVELNLVCILKDKVNKVSTESVCYFHGDNNIVDNEESKDKVVRDYNFRLLPFINKSDKLINYILKQ